MQVNDFGVNKTYAITTKDWGAPDGSGTVPGKSMTITVPPAQEFGEALSFDGVEVSLATHMGVEARKGFLRVRRDNGLVHQLHPETIASCSQVN